MLDRTADRPRVHEDQDAEILQHACMMADRAEWPAVAIGDLHG